MVFSEHFKYKMKNKFFNYEWKLILVSLIIFFVGIVSFAYSLNCLLSNMNLPLCSFAQIISIIFAFDIFIGAIITTHIQIFNDFNFGVVVLHFVYSYLLSCVIFWLIGKRKNKR